MGTPGERKKFSNGTFAGMSERNAKIKLKELFAEKNPATNFNRVNKDFTTTYAISLLGLCEMWHRLRSDNTAVAAMIHSFAHTLAAKNELNHKLSGTIHTQREELAKRIAELDRTKAKLLKLNQ